MIYLDWGKYNQKPRQRGPWSSVQRDVKYNAERLGIDPNKIVGLWPFWEGAGLPINIITGVASTKIGSGQQWVGSGFKVNSSGGLELDVNQPFIALDEDFTWLWKGSVPSDDGSACILGNRYNGTSSPLQFAKFYHDAFQFYNAGATTVSYSALGALPEDEDFITSAVKNSGGLIELYFDGALDDSATTSKTMDPNPIYAGCGSNTNQESTNATFDLILVGKFALSASQNQQFRETPYALLQPAPRPFIFDLGAGGGTVNSNFTIQFDINNLIESDFQAVYDVLNLVNSSFVISYDIFNLTNSDFQTLFDIAGKASSDLQIVYDISGNRVPSDFVVTYDVLEKVNSEMVITFDLLNSVFSDFAPVYDIRQLVNSDFEIVFDLNNLVGSDFTILYDMAGRTFSDFTVRFDLGDVPVVVVRGSGIGLKIGIGI